jgi:dihydrofolate reductase
VRSLNCNLFMTIDGVVESPGDWSLSYWTDQIAGVVSGSMSAADALLLGRVGYQEFAAAWSGRTSDDDEGADFMNGIRKYVVSSTLTSVDWNNSTLLEGEVADSVAALKATEGGDIMTSGSPMLVRSLLDLGLVDELRLLVYPIVRGHGKRLGEGEGDGVALELVSSETFDNGVVHLVYRRAG